MAPIYPYAFLRQVIESDLPYFARCIGVSTGLPYEKWNNILESLKLQYHDEEDCWRPNTRVMVMEGRPVFLLEVIDGQVFFTGPPSWSDHSRRMMLAWQAALVYFFLRMGLREIKTTIPAYRTGEVAALERLGGQRIGVITDRTGTNYQYVCRMEDFWPVI